jgi:hypothetical protein
MVSRRLTATASSRSTYPGMVVESDSMRAPASPPIAAAAPVDAHATPTAAAPLLRKSSIVAAPVTTSSSEVLPRTSAVPPR